MAIALESCAMAAIHAQVFRSIIERHQAEDMALQVFLGQLLGGQYSIYGTSPDMHVQVRCSYSYRLDLRVQGRAPVVTYQTVYAASWLVCLKHKSM